MRNHYVAIIEQVQSAPDKECAFSKCESKGFFDDIGHNQPGSVLTAAFYAKPTLHFAAVRQEGRQNFCLEPSRCASFTFEERSASETVRLLSKVRQFLNLTSTKKVLLRSGGLRGTYVQHPFAFKAEAVLDLTPGLRLSHVDNSLVANWKRKQLLQFPQPEATGFTRAWRNGHSKAIEAAVFGLAHSNRMSRLVGSEG